MVDQNQTISPIPPQTPLYRSLFASRYLRQDMIRDIEQVTQRQLIVYYGAPYSLIDKNDVIGFADLLQGKSDADIDLMLQSPGGDIDIAEKLVYLCRSRSKTFRVIVPESAKSAATLIALASDGILMSDTSELGPIDPQVQVTTSEGTSVVRPAQSYLDGLQAIREQADADNRLSPAYFPLLLNLDPALLDFCQKAIDRSRAFAEKWLKESQCKGNPGRAEEIAKTLSDTKRYLSHGAVIDREEAKRIGLNVISLSPDDALWQRIWRLFCKYETDRQQEGFAKVFEGRQVSLPLIRSKD